METISSIQGNVKAAIPRLHFSTIAAGTISYFDNSFLSYVGKGCVYTFALRGHQGAKRALCESRHTNSPHPPRRVILAISLSIN